MTYSIVGRDPGTGHLGLAVQTHVFAAGRLVDHVRAGVGAVASQATALYAHGTRVLDALADGWTATDALAASLARDDMPAVRQVAVLPARGAPAAHTGADCIPHAGHVVGDDWVVAGNIMATDEVVPAMAAAAERAWAGDASLAQRLLAALRAAEAAGGDVRGSQSASMIVLRDEATGDPLVDTVVDVRVDDHPDPVEELARLVALDEGDELLHAAQELLEQGDVDRAVAAYAHALDVLAPMRDTTEAAVWAALHLADAGRADAATAAIARVHDHPTRPAMEALTDRLVLAGRLERADVRRWWGRSAEA